MRAEEECTRAEERPRPGECARVGPRRLPRRLQLPFPSHLSHPLGLLRLLGKDALPLLGSESVDVVGAAARQLLVAVGDAAQPHHSLAALTIEGSLSERLPLRLKAGA